MTFLNLLHTSIKAGLRKHWRQQSRMKIREAQSRKDTAYAPPLAQNETLDKPLWVPLLHPQIGLQFKSNFR